jgi:P-type conjugative transfer protein TrbJ
MGQQRSNKDIPMKLKKLFSSTAVTAVFVFAAMPSAHAGGGGFVGAMESTQWMNNAELVNVYTSNLEQLQQQIQMYQNMYQNTLGIPIQAWSGIAGRLTSLVSTIQNTQSIVNATVNSITDMQTTYGNGNLLSNQQQNLMNWNKGLNNQIGAALQQLGYNANNFSTTQSALQQIQLASQTSAGGLQAIQAGNQIAGMMVNETQGLHGTIIAADQARLNAVAKQENGKYQDEILYRNFFRNHSGQY